MKNNFSKLFSVGISLIFITAFLGFCSLASADTKSADLPQRSLGDKWVYSVDYTIPIGMIGTLTYEVTNTSAIISETNNGECIEFTQTGSGTLYGGSSYGNWTLTGKQYENKNDYSILRVEGILDFVINNGSGGLDRLTQTVEIIYDPPYEFNKGFPLLAGKSWSSETNETINRKLDYQGEYVEESLSNITTSNFIVFSNQHTQVTAGEFDSYLIKITKNTGTIIEYYYAPEVQLQIKELDYDSTGNIAATLELIDYKIKLNNTLDFSDSSSLIIALGIGAFIIAIVVAVGLLRKKRKSFK